VEKHLKNMANYGKINTELGKIGILSLFFPCSCVYTWANKPKGGENNE